VLEQAKLTAVLVREPYMACPIESSVGSDRIFWLFSGSLFGVSLLEVDAGTFTTYHWEYFDISLEPKVEGKSTKKSRERTTYLLTPLCPSQTKETQCPHDINAVQIKHIKNEATAVLSSKPS
jgi:hypothetical protein